MMFPDKPSLLLLNDGRIGNYKQNQAISYYLKEDFNIVEKKISFSPLINLPNFINYTFNIGFDQKLFNNIEKPDFILSAGRRSALVAAYCKKKFGSKIIQIMRPNLPYKLFDFIITPKHDNYPYCSYETNLTPTTINQNIIAQMREKYVDKYPQNKKIVGVIIGGDSKRNKVGTDDFQKLCNYILKIKKQSNKDIFITTSRRTGAKNEKFINQILAGKAKIYNWGNDIDNPYLEIISYSDNIIVTSDSISMISDAIASKANVYLFEDGFTQKKHQKFISNLKNKGYIRNIDDFFTNQKNDNNNNKIIDEAKQIAFEIKAKFL